MGAVAAEVGLGIELRERKKVQSEIMHIVIEPQAPPHEETPPEKLLSRFNVVSLLLFALAACAMLYWALPRTMVDLDGGRHDLTLPAPGASVLALDKPGSVGPQSIVLAGGCFWGVQLVFQHTHGVISAVSGFAGGQAGDANYSWVSSGATHHAEAVQVQFDPQQVTLAQLLQIYFAVVHDPTQLNRQYPDEGAQYRSAVFVQDDRQQQITQSYIDQLDAAAVFPAKIVTQISALKGFYPAEPEHQNYALRNPTSPYIAQFDLPKLTLLKTQFAPLYRDQPTWVTP